MAGPGEKIEIQITGDSSDLANSLKDVAERIQALVDALAGTTQKFNETGQVGVKTMESVEASADKTTKATQKLSSNTKKLADAMDKSAKSGKDFTKLAMTTTTKLELAADSAGRSDSAMSAFASALDRVNPELAENARLAADVAGMTEQAILAWTQAKGAVIGIGMALAIWEAGMARAEKTLERQIEKNEQLSKIYDQQHKFLARVEKKRAELDQGLKRALGTEETAVEVYRKEIAEIDNLIDKQKERTIAQVNARRWHNKELDDLEKLRDQMVGVAEATLMANSMAETWAQRAGSSEKTTKSMANAIGSARAEIVQWEDGSGRLRQSFVMTEEAIRQTSGALQEQNKDVAVGGAAVDGFQEKIAQLNFSLSELGEAPDTFDTWVLSMKGANSETGDTAKAFGALNVLTGETIGLVDLANMSMEKFVDSQNKSVETTTKQVSKYDDLSGVLEMLANMQFQAEQSIRGEIEARTKQHEKDMEMLDELADEYRKSAKVLNAIDSARQAVVEEFAAERVELEKQAAAEIIRENRAMEDQLKALSNISRGRTFDTREYAIKQLEITRDEQLNTLKRMEEDLRAAGHVELEIDRLVKAERLDIEAEYLQAKEALNDEYDLKAKEGHKDLIAEGRAELDSFLSSSVGFANAIGEVMGAFDEGITHMSIESRKKLFAAQKVAAISSTIIAGTQAGIQAYADLGATPAAVVASAAIAAETAAAVATIIAQQPSFDIGGVVRGGVMSKSNDQVPASLLPGESVLNRRATEALGEQGVNALNSGGSVGQQVVVVPAYKHFDRFIKDEYRRGGSFRNIVTKQREFPVGRRSY